MNRIYRHCVAVICIMMLGGCGMIDYVYKKAPAYVASELDEAFDLSESQIGQLDSRLEQFFTWHRQQELGRYQRLLEQAAIAVADGISAAEFLQLNHEVRLAWQRSLAKAIDNLGDLVVTLDQQQIENYQRYHRASAEEYEAYLQKSLQQREVYRVGRSIDRLEDWFGDFSHDQEEKIRARLQRLPDFYEPWIVYREARQQALVLALNNATDKGLAPQQLRTILLDPSTAYARTFEPARQSYWRAYAVALEDISSWLTAAQKRKVVKKLEKYARIAARLTDAG